MRGKEINGKIIVEFEKSEHSTIISCLNCYYKQCYDCPRNKVLFGFVNLMKGKGNENIQK